MLYSPNGTYDQLYLGNYAVINVIDALKRIPGVGDAMLFGALDYSMRIWLDPDKLTNLRLTPAEVAAAIQSQNVQAAVGRSEEHTSELQSLMRSSYAVFSLKKKRIKQDITINRS